MELRPGATINNALRLVRLIGQGGMGSVWEAHHLALDTRVAVKFIRTSTMDRDSGEALARFRREAMAAAKIQSPHVVQTFDRGEMATGTAYMVMEFLAGLSLGEVLRRSGPLRPVHAVAVVKQVARALRAAHKSGVIHRDIKPDNIFLVANDEAEVFCKVLDFGIAKSNRSMTVDGEATTTGALMGSPKYMSPEQLMSAKDVDHHADLWALSVVAYRLLTGGLPFVGDTFPALCISICGAVFVPPSTRKRDLSAQVDAWFARAFSLEAADRFASAAELSHQFGALFPNASACPFILPQRGLQTSAQQHATAVAGVSGASFVSVSEASASSLSGDGHGAAPATRQESPSARKGALERMGALAEPAAQSPVSGHAAVNSAQSHSVQSHSVQSHSVQSHSRSAQSLSDPSRMGSSSSVRFPSPLPVPVLERDLAQTRPVEDADLVYPRLGPTVTNDLDPPTEASIGGASTNVSQYPRHRSPKKSVLGPLAVFAAVLLPGVAGIWYLAARGRTPDAVVRGAATSVSAGPPVLGVTGAASPSASGPAAPQSASAIGTTSVQGGARTVRLPAGEYAVGCPSPNATCFADEQPRHLQTFLPIWLMTYEVTADQYSECVQAEHCRAPQKGSGCVVGGQEAQNCVSWTDAATYCAFRKGRLPTEFEWEVAASNSGQSFPFVDAEPSCKVTVMADASGGACGGGQVAKVGSRTADRSWLGAYDLGGNVREWTSSDYAAYPGGAVESGSKGKVNRGGSYVMKKSELNRLHTRAVDRRTERRPDLGFRCAFDAEQ